MPQEITISEDDLSITKDLIKSALNNHIVHPSWLGKWAIDTRLPRDALVSYEALVSFCSLLQMEEDFIIRCLSIYRLGKD